MDIDTKVFYLSLWSEKNTPDKALDMRHVDLFM